MSTLPLCTRDCSDKCRQGVLLYFANSGEWMDWHTYRTHQKAQLSILEYIEGFYHRQRGHSTLDSDSPATKESFPLSS